MFGAAICIEKIKRCAVLWLRVCQCSNLLLERKTGHKQRAAISYMSVFAWFPLLASGQRADFVINMNMEMSRRETDPTSSSLQVMLDFVFGIVPLYDSASVLIISYKR